MQKNTLFRTMFLLLLPVMLTAQTYTWEWAERGGGEREIDLPIIPYNSDFETVLDIKFDKDNNFYYLIQIGSDQTSFGNIPITTYNDNNARRDVLLLSTDSSGNFRWSKTIGGNFNDFSTSIGIDNNDEIYLAGSAYPSLQQTPVHFDNDTVMNLGSPNIQKPSNKNLFLIKYSKNGDYRWLRQPQSDTLTLETNVSVNSYEKVAAQHFDMDISSDGTTHWLAEFKSGNHLNGNLIVSNSEESKTVIVKYDASGNYLSHIDINLDITHNYTNIDMDYDPVNNRYYIAVFRENQSYSLSYNDIPAVESTFLIAIDASGNLLWRKDDEQNDYFKTKITAIQTDDNGDLYIGGNSINTDFDNNLFVESIGGYYFDQLLDDMFGTNAPFLIKLNLQGDLIWGTNANKYSAAGISDIAFYNNTVIAGLAINESATWDDYTISPNNGYQPTLVFFNASNGSVTDLKEVSGPSFEDIDALSVDQFGNIVVGGMMEDSIFNNNSNLPTLTKTGGQSDFFIAKLACQNCTMGIDDAATGQDIVLFPNPAKGHFQLEGKELLSEYRIYDLQGRSVQQGQLTNDLNKIDITGLKTGIYMVKVTDQQGQKEVLKLVVK